MIRHARSIAPLGLLVVLGCAASPAATPTESSAAAPVAAAGSPASPAAAEGRAATTPEPLTATPAPGGQSIGVESLLPPAHDSKPLARVDGDPVTADELFAELFLSQTEATFAALKQAIHRRLIVKEATRSRITVRDSVLDPQVAAVLKAQDDEFKLQAGPQASFEDYVGGRFGTAPAAYRATIRQRVLEELLLARVIRFQNRQHDRIEVRMIVVDSRPLADEIATKLKQGANFAALAKQHSLDASKPQGGLYPPIPVDVANPLLGEARQLAPGQVSEVEAFDRDGRSYFRLLKLERRLAADPRPYAAQEGDIESELTQRPLELLEVLEWEARMGEQYPIEVYLGQA